MGFLTIAVAAAAFISLLCVFGAEYEEEHGQHQPPLRNASTDQSPSSTAKSGGIGVIERDRHPYAAATSEQPRPSTPTTSTTRAREPRPYAYTPTSPAGTRVKSTYTSPATPPPSPPPPARVPRPYAYVPQKVSPSESTPLVREPRPYAQAYGATDHVSDAASPTPPIERERRPYQHACPTELAPSPEAAAKSLPTPPPSPGTPSRDIADNAELRDLLDAEALRAKANAKKERIKDCRRMAQAEPDARQKRKLRLEMRETRKEIEELDGIASKIIFAEKNKSNKKNVVDLHGLYTHEALRYVKVGIDAAIERDDAEVRFIVGKGIHSIAGEAKIKPAVLNYLQDRKLRVVNVHRNEGSLIVKLRSKSISKND